MMMMTTTMMMMSCICRLNGKPETFKTLRSSSLKSQSLPNLAPRLTNFPPTGNTSHQAANHDNREQGHSNETDNNVVHISVIVPDIRAKKRKRKLKRQASLSERIDEFYKKLDDFETKDQYTASERDYFLPPLQEWKSLQGSMCLWYLRIKSWRKYIKSNFLRTTMKCVPSATFWIA